MFDGIAMTQAKIAVFVHGETTSSGVQLVEILGEPAMREDMVRLERGVADIRFRAQYWPWSAVLKVEYNAIMLGQEVVVNLVEAAGYGGIGEWRPSAPKSATGQHGMFQIDRTAAVSATSN
jgi:hypothetical protein